VKYLASVGRRFGDKLAKAFPGLEGRRRDLKPGPTAIRAYERRRCQRLIAGPQEIPGMQIYWITNPAPFRTKIATCTYGQVEVESSTLARRNATWKTN
jgi:selenocysteine lyase/cysteine desulfurase